MDDMSYVNYVMFGSSVPDIDLPDENDDKKNNIDSDNWQKYVTK